MLECDVARAIEEVKNHNRIFIHGAAATPLALIEGLIDQADRLIDVEICHIHTEGTAPYALPQYEKSFKINNFFVGANIRPMVGLTRTQYVPVFLSEIPLLFRNQVLPLDIAFIHVSPPDRHGFCSLGLSVDVTKSAIESAKIVIAQINPKMPRSHGDGMVHISEINYGVWVEADIPVHNPSPVSAIDAQIGQHVAAIIEDGACLQMGIGSIPDAVLSCLDNHKHLGIHTEMFSDGILPLVAKGVIDGSNKKNHPGKIVSTFAIGSKALYDFVNDNPSVALLDVSYTNDTAVIRKNHKTTAINSAIEIDLTGQICADSIGSKMFSGVGGQMDFIRGSTLSKGGKPIIAMRSTAGNTKSKIVPTLKVGAGVVTTRAHIHYIATEYGIVDLFGKNLAQRAKLLISIAHPDCREQLEKDAYELFGQVW